MVRYEERIDPGTGEAYWAVFDRGEALLWVRHVQSDGERRARVTRGETAHAVQRSRCQHDSFTALQHEVGEGIAEAA